MRRIGRWLLAASVAATVGTGFAGTASADGFWERMHRQRDRIEQGVRNGDLTRREAERLTQEQREIWRQRQRLADRGDGLSRRDRAILQDRLNRQSERIREQRRDDDTRGRRDRYADRGDWRFADRWDWDDDRYDRWYRDGWYRERD